jgi:hypothetical protein
MLLITRFSSVIDILVSLDVSVASGRQAQFIAWCCSFEEDARKALNMPRGHVYTSDLNMTQETMHCDLFELWKLVKESTEA